MEFLSVGLDKQPQFCSRDRSQPKQRRRRLRRDARFSTPLHESFLSSLAVIFGSRHSLFRLERNFSRTALRALSLVISLLLLRSTRPILPLSSLFPLLVSSCRWSYIAIEKQCSYCTQHFVTVQGMCVCFSLNIDLVQPFDIFFSSSISFILFRCFYVCKSLPYSYFFAQKLSLFDTTFATFNSLFVRLKFPIVLFILGWNWMHPTITRYRF